MSDPGRTPATATPAGSPTRPAQAPATPATPPSVPPARPLAPDVARARQRVHHAHASLEHDLDSLSEATAAALDIPAKIRRNPVKSVALAGGAGFVLLGGPRRLIRSAASRIFPRKADPYAGLLPDEVERVLRHSGAADVPGVREALEADFAEYLRTKGRPTRPQPSASTSFWRTYDALLGPLGTVGARLLVERLFAADRGRRSKGRG